MDFYGFFHSLAGMPTTVSPSGTSLVTKDILPTMLLSFIIFLFITTEFGASQQLSFITADPISSEHAVITLFLPIVKL